MVFRMGQMISSALFAKLGLLAGYLFGDVFVLVYCARVSNKVVSNSPVVAFNFYVDDIGASCNGPRRQVRRELPKAVVDPVEWKKERKLRPRIVRKTIEVFPRNRSWETFFCLIFCPFVFCTC